MLSDAEQVEDYRDAESGDLVDLTRTTCIERLPPVLLLHLKRFAFCSSSSSSTDSEDGWEVRKLLKLLPVRQRLQLRGSIMSDKGAFIRAHGMYELAAVVYHVGNSAEQGHYTALSLSKSGIDEGETAIYFDDTQVYVKERQRQTQDMGRSQQQQQQQKQDQRWWTHLLGSHRPFNASTGEFGTIASSTNASSSSPHTHITLDTIPSLDQQPRTPYILIYVSCFSK